MDTQAKLTSQHFPADLQVFSRAPVLISGEREAILIDSGFTFSDGKLIVEAIKTAERC
ncbi:hypothetical protein MYA83_15490 [Pseudomonas palleroniana]|uniref:hypothetical protein n=1 Tax=Pseudomonas palleroniana TaxID=191390 RepID=UPI003B009BBA